MVRSRVGTPSNTVQTGADATVRLAAELDLDVQGRYFDGLERPAPTRWPTTRTPASGSGTCPSSSSRSDVGDRDHRRARIGEVVGGAGVHDPARQCGIAHGAIESEQLAGAHRGWTRRCTRSSSAYSPTSGASAPALRRRGHDGDPGGPRRAAPRHRRRRDARRLPVRAGRRLRRARARPRARALGRPEALAAHARELAAASRRCRRRRRARYGRPRRGAVAADLLAAARAPALEAGGAVGGGCGAERPWDWRISETCSALSSMIRKIAISTSRITRV